jgi:hypothetical protein
MFSHLVGTTTTRSTADARSWWAEESVRVGTDWVSVAETVTGILHRLRATSSLWCSS